MARPAGAPLIEDMRSEWRGLDERIMAFDDELAVRARAEDATRRLTTIPEVGVLTATALVATVGNASMFSRGRDLAAWLGGTAPGNDCWLAEVAWHQQAGQPLRAHADPRRPDGFTKSRPDRLSRPRP